MNYFFRIWDRGIPSSPNIELMMQINKDFGSYEKFKSLFSSSSKVVEASGWNLLVMNGNTWKKYRVLKYTNGDSPFLLENVNPKSHNEILLKAGFKEMYTYTSTKGLIEDVYKSEGLIRAEKRIEAENIKIKLF